jgi:hypothetical protein
MKWTSPANAKVNSPVAALVLAGPEGAGLADEDPADEVADRLDEAGVGAEVDARLGWPAPALVHPATISRTTASAPIEVEKRISRRCRGSTALACDESIRLSS